MDPGPLFSECAIIFFHGIPLLDGKKYSFFENTPENNGPASMKIKKGSPSLESEGDIFPRKIVNLRSFFDHKK